MKQKNKKILAACIAASFFFHALAISFFQQYSLWFFFAQKVEDSSDWLSLIDKQERDQILQATFDPISTTDLATNPEQEVALSQHTPVALPDHPLKPLLFQAPPPPINEMLATRDARPTFQIPSNAFNLLDHLPRDLAVPVREAVNAPLFPPTPAAASRSIAVKQITPNTNPHIPRAELKNIGGVDAPQMARIPDYFIAPKLPKLPSLQDLNTASYSDSFDAELVFLPKDDGEGYIFALTLIPRQNLELPRLRQHVTFLIDKSNSIQQSRLNATKAAVHKALEELLPEDTFNIIAFDSKMEKMAPNALPAGGKSFATAEAFLDQVRLGSFFSMGDLYRPLLMTVPGKVELDETYTAILLTDGESLVRRNTQQSLLYDWTQYNQGKVALFAVGINDAHAPTLETAATFNKGKFLNAQSERGLKRKLAKLLKNIQHPVAKSIACKAISRSPNNRIEVIAASNQMPNLYLEQPYVILGSTNTLDDFILFVQGRLKDRWVNIKKTISFINAKKGSKALKEEWAVASANTLYMRYLIDDNMQHLVDAKELLTPYNIPVAFQ